MAKFDLNRAKAGDAVRTVGFAAKSLTNVQVNSDVTEVRVFDRLLYPMVTAIVDNTTIYWWDAEGKLINSPDVEPPGEGVLDLEMVTEKMVKWVNLFHTFDVSKPFSGYKLFDTKEEAEKEAVIMFESLSTKPKYIGAYKLTVEYSFC